MELNTIRKVNPVTIFLGGRERVIQYDMNAFAELETRYGNMDLAVKALSSGKVKDVRVSLWAGLIHEEAILDENGEPTGYNITPYQVGSWLTSPAEMNDAIIKIGTALGDSTPAADAMAPKTKSKAKGKEVAPLPEGTATVVMTPEEQAAEKNA
ncbi:hypothetical protein D3C71_539430 [compost metagenome]